MNSKDHDQVSHEAGHQGVVDESNVAREAGTPTKRRRDEIDAPHPPSADASLEKKPKAKESPRPQRSSGQPNEPVINIDDLTLAVPHIDPFPLPESTSLDTVLFGAQGDSMPTPLQYPNEDAASEILPSYMEDPSSLFSFMPVDSNASLEHCDTSLLESNVARLPSSRPPSPSIDNALGIRLFPTREEIEQARSTRAGEALNTFYKRLRELYNYKKEHGHCNVPQKQNELGRWVNNQRRQKKLLDENDKASSMTPGRLDALTRISFTWAVPKGDESWENRFQELQAYKRHHGNVDVPTKYTSNRALGRWVSTQRAEYKKFHSAGGEQSSLTKEKIQKLQRMGFKWDMANH